MTITLYEFPSSRSARVRWTLLELDLSFESLSGDEAFAAEDFSQVSPLRKIPAIKSEHGSLFESAAICTWLADSHPDQGLSFPSGTWERALHDQWVSFILTELEAHLWSSFRNLVRYKEEQRIPEITKQNNWEAAKSLKVIEKHLTENDYMVGGKFTVTDIIVSYALNWANIAKLIDNKHPSTIAYMKRVFDRPHCTIKPS